MGFTPAIFARSDEESFGTMSDAVTTIELKPYLDEDGNISWEEEAFLEPGRYEVRLLGPKDEELAQFLATYFTKIQTITIEKAGVYVLAKDVIVTGYDPKNEGIKL